jgi:hypothetical protein
MEALGLMPSHTGAPGGARTGQRMSHYVLAGGPFHVACDRLLASGFRLIWQSREKERHPNPRKNKAKYTCSKCGQNAWAQPDVDLVCGVCDESMAHGPDPLPGQKRKTPEPPPPTGPAPAGADWQPQVKKWFADLSKRFHPDKGGTDEQMRVVNIARELLVEVLQQARA